MQDKVLNIQAMDELQNFGKSKAQKFCTLLKAVPVALVVLGLTLFGAVPVQAQDQYESQIAESIAMEASFEEGSAKAPEHRERASRLVPFSSYTVPALREKVSLRLEGAPVEQALRQISAEANFKLSYGSEAVVVDKEVMLRLEEVTARTALQEVVRGTDLKLMLSRSGQVVVVRESNQASKPVRLGMSHAKPVKLQISPLRVQTGTITGTVTDSTTGDAIPGVNVAVVGTQQGASTDAEGNYTIAGVEAGTYDLRASFVGYTTKLIEDVGVTDNETTVVDFFLRPSTLALEEVVAIGYGEQQAADVTGSVASVPMRDVESIPVTGISEAITGKVPGVQVSTVTGVPGGGPSVRIRGVGSIGAGNDPLYVVDGFPIPDSPGQRVNPLNSIPPEQVESIEVLKDASATAIYGSRGANGVVLITTKKGTSQTQVQVYSSFGMQNVRRTGMVDVLNAREFAQFKKERISDQIRFFEGREPVPEDIPEMYRNPEQYGEGTDWPGAVTRNALRQNHGISFSGGNEAIRSRVSASFTDQRGTLIETGYRRYTLRANIDAYLYENLNIGVNVAPSFEQQALQSTDGEDGRGGVYASSFLVNPIQPIRDADGTLTPMVDGPGVLPFPNPVFKARAIDNDLKRVRAIANAFADYELLTGLNVRSSFNVNWSNSNQQRFEPTTVGGGFSYPPQDADGLYSTVTGLTWVNENTLNYRTNAGNHNFDGLIGVTVEESTVDFGSFRATNYPDDEIKTFNAAPTIGGSTNISEWALLSGLARLKYNYGRKYFLTGTVRRDGSSRFGPENRWGTFPSFSVGWRLSDEPFMERIPHLGNLMLRVGYGQSGNYNIGNYRHLGTISSSPYAINSEQVAGRSITNLGNTALGWEQVEQLNAGIDVSVLQNRLTLTADYYNKVSSAMLLEVETPLTSGFSTALDNRGEVTNKGVEVALSAVPISTPIWNWDVDFNISRNVNEVTQLDSRILTPASTGQHITEEGYPIGMFYGYAVEGFYEDMEEIEDHIPNGSAMPGAYRHRDVNGDGQIDPIQDFVRIGNPYPDFTWGLSTTLNYRSFDFNVSATGSHGAEKLQTGYEDFYNLDGVFNVSTDALNRWRSPEDPGEGRIPRAISTVIHRYNQSVWVLDSSTFWLRNVTLGYTFNASRYGVINALGTREIRLYLNVNNAWISNTNFQNPEESLFSNNPLRPSETRNLNYPISRTYTIGLNIRL